jgi:hypothetical protein
MMRFKTLLQFATMEDPFVSMHIILNPKTKLILNIKNKKETKET